MTGLIVNDSVATEFGTVPVYDKAPKRMLYEQDETPVLDDATDDVSRETFEIPLTLPRPKQPRIIVVANQKGGVGKTTTTVNIATGLAHGGLNVLVCDLDPQGNASTALGVEPYSNKTGTYEVLLDGDKITNNMIRGIRCPNLWCLPATLDLAGAEIGLVNVYGRERQLENAIKQLLDEKSFDYIFFDCPPSLGLLTLNALVAANEILVPIQCEYYALEGLTQLMRTVEMVKKEINPNLMLSTVLLTMYDGRNKLSEQVADEVRKFFPKETLQTVIPRSVRVAEAPSYGETVLTYEPNSKGAVAYRKVAAEIANKVIGG